MQKYSFSNYFCISIATEVRIAYNDKQMTFVRYTIKRGLVGVLPINKERKIIFAQPYSITSRKFRPNDFFTFLSAGLDELVST